MWDLHGVERKTRAGRQLKQVRSLRGKRGAGAGSPAAQCRGVPAEALGNSECCWEPRGGTSAAVSLLLAFCRWQILWHQQTFFVSRIIFGLINSQEGTALLCP